jgi:RNA polymerase sigma factor (sigma-70 family)
MSPSLAGNREIAFLISASQRGDDDATEVLLQRFRPLLRARFHEIWARLREDVSSLEWEDVEAQLTAFFLARLQAFRVEQGVYFPHYIATMLELDARDWLKKQRRSIAVPFSQLEALQGVDGDENAEDGEWWLRDERQSDHGQSAVDNVVLQDALALLPFAHLEVIELCCVQGKSEDAAARVLGISRSAVHNRLQTALSKLREHLELEEENTMSGTRTGRAVKSKTDEFENWRRRMKLDDKRPDLVGVGAGKPILLQGVFDFPATGMKNSQLLSTRLRYVVPIGFVAGLRFFRAGVTCEKMVCLSTVVNGLTHRLIPLAPNSTMHVPFAIVEPLVGGSEIEIHVASDAPGVAIIDVGGLLMPA